MGFPMAGYLSKTNDVSVYNRSKEKMDKWQSVYKGKVINDKNLRYKFVKNSRSILENCHTNVGKNYFLEKIFEIIK